MTSGDPALQSRVLEALAGARNYRRWVCDLAMPFLGDDPLELGSGLGDHAQEWLDAGLPRITVSEDDPTRAAQLWTRFATNSRVDVADVPTRRDYSSVVALNVLEHIADDVSALRAARQLVRPDGAVVVFVPAIPAAMSNFDREIGHYRRYTSSTLRQAFASANLSVKRLRYVNAPGLAAWFVGMRLLGMTPREGVVLSAWDRLVVPVAHALEKRLRPPIGQSLFAVAVRHDSRVRAVESG